jgi:CheY-like chemotaxis protein/anti-sigma regulatory factor (Ser/Thr protein kinase)
MEEVPFSLQAVIDQTQNIIASRAADKGLKLHTRVGPSVPPGLSGDPTRLRQVLVNLLGNAVKFTSRGSVTLRVAVEKRMEDAVRLHFAIRDTGIGIPADKLDLVFEPFTQVDGSTTRKFGGTGLGLTIVRRLVEKFDGRVWIESEIDKGTTFHFTARFGLAEAPIVQETPVDQPSGRDLAGLKVLVAEDSPVNQHVMTRMLAKKGWEVTIASDGLKVVEQAMRGSFDLILMDVQMPRLDGFEATGRIRRHERKTGSHVPIIALTAHAMQGDRERCLAAGMDDYLSKPVRANELYAAIERISAGRAPTAGGEVGQAAAGGEYDRAEALTYVGDDPDLLHEVMRMFRDEWPKGLAAIQAAAATGDTETARIQAHRLKGQSAVLGAREARAAANRIEELGEQGDLPAVRSGLSALAAALERLDRALADEPGLEQAGDANAAEVNPQPTRAPR